MQIGMSSSSDLSTSSTDKKRSYSKMPNEMAKKRSLSFNSDSSTSSSCGASPSSRSNKKQMKLQSADNLEPQMALSTHSMALVGKDDLLSASFREIQEAKFRAQQQQGSLQPLLTQQAGRLPTQVPEEIPQNQRSPLDPRLFSLLSSSTNKRSAAANRNSTTAAAIAARSASPSSSMISPTASAPTASRPEMNQLMKYAWSLRQNEAGASATSASATNPGSTLQQLLNPEVNLQALSRQVSQVQSLRSASSAAGSGLSSMLPTLDPITAAMMQHRKQNALRENALRESVIRETAIRENAILRESLIRENAILQEAASRSMMMQRLNQHQQTETLSSLTALNPKGLQHAHQLSALATNLDQVSSSTGSLSMSQHLAATAGIPVCLPFTLALPEDNSKLSSHQVLLRHQIEAFKASEDDVSTHTRGRNKPVMLGQVGIRCRHCAHLPVIRREKGSTYFPSSLKGLYQAAQNMSTTHMQSGVCNGMSQELKNQFMNAMSSKVNSSGAGRQYWAETAKKLGLVDTEEGGIRFIRDLL